MEASVPLKPKMLPGHSVTFQAIICGAWRDNSLDKLFVKWRAHIEGKYIIIDIAAQLSGSKRQRRDTFPSRAFATKGKL